jgi:hypothetical protein
MTESLAVEWGRYGIRLNAIAPGPFPVESTSARLNPGQTMEERAAGKNPMGRIGQMHELQHLAAFLMADGCEWLTGQTIALDGALLGAGSFYVRGWIRGLAGAPGDQGVNEKDTAAVGVRRCAGEEVSLGRAFVSPRTSAWPQAKMKSPW